MVITMYKEVPPLESAHVINRCPFSINRLASLIQTPNTLDTIWFDGKDPNITKRGINLQS